MKFLFVLHRWGEDFVGGAELHHRRLAEELIDAGHQVTVLTTTGHDIAPFAHWGVHWTERDTSVEESKTNIPVRRVPQRKLPLAIRAFMAKAVQWQMEREESRLSLKLIKRLEKAWTDRHGIHLLHGWHLAESHDGKTTRWSQRRAWVSIRSCTSNPVRIILRGHAPKKRKLSIKDESGKVLKKLSIQPGWFDEEVHLATGFNGFLCLELDGVWRPLKDHRGLGLQVHDLEIHSDGEPYRQTDFLSDYRAFGRIKQSPWRHNLLTRSRKRPSWANLFINELRGPQSSQWKTTLRKERKRHDVVVYGNFPWSTMDRIDKGDVALPIWHIEDDYYYFEPWIRSLHNASLIMANTPYTAKEFFPKIYNGLEKNAFCFVGPPIWEPKVSISEKEVQKLRSRFRIQSDEIMVLTVCRKTPEKRYDLIGKAVAELRAEGLPVRMVGVGPDQDGRLFELDGCEWAGKLLGDELQVAYGACDIFAFMSESESFGMVIPEAWHHGKPVIVNRNCPASASLLNEGEDGLLASSLEELKVSIRMLAEDGKLREDLGEAGRKKAQEHYVRGAAARRFLEGLGRLGSAKSS